MLQNELLKRISKKMVAKPDDYMSSFRENLGTFVDSKGISLKDIADEAGLSIETVKTLLYGEGKDCKLSTAIALARALGLSVDELVGAGTLSPVMCESIQITRNLPVNFVYFVRWSIRYHERMLREKKATKKAINIMLAEAEPDGSMIMNNNFRLMDISNLPDSQWPKIYLGVEIPTDNYMPVLYEGDVLLIANDRKALQNEMVVVVVNGYLWLGRKHESYVNGVKKTVYKSLLSDGGEIEFGDIEEVLGYVVHIHRE